MSETGTTETDRAHAQIFHINEPSVTFVYFGRDPDGPLARCQLCGALVFDTSEIGQLETVVHDPTWETEDAHFDIEIRPATSLGFQIDRDIEIRSATKLERPVVRFVRQRSQ